MKQITREWLRANNACYSDETIAELVPVEGLTPLEVTRLDIPDADKVWVLTHPDVLTRDALIAFAKGCAERARGYAASAYAYAAASASEHAYAAASAAEHAYAAASAAAYAHAASADAAARAAERQAQVKHLIGLLEKEGEK